MIKLLLTAVATSVVAVGLSAQKTSPLKTATDYGTTATAGKTNNSNSVKKGTAGTAKGVSSISRASEGKNKPTARATATSSANAIATKAGSGVIVTETGSAQTTEEKGSASAGTTTTKGGKSGAAHAITWTGAVKPNTKGTLNIVFTNRRVTDGAAMVFAVEVDGKGVDKFSGKDKSSKKSLPFTTGSKGLTVTISSSGSAAVKAKGAAGYSGSVSVTFATGGGGGGGSNCAPMRPYGKGCGAWLAGKVTPGKTDNTLSLTTKNIPKGAPTVLIVGKVNTKGIKIPGSKCMIYADPTIVMVWKDPSTAKFTFKAGRAEALGIQAAYIVKGKNANTVGTTNAVALNCKDVK
jgi:hypothetical protein